MKDEIIYNNVWDKIVKTKRHKIKENKVEEGGIKESDIDMG